LVWPQPESTKGWCTQPANSQLIPQSTNKYLGLARLAWLSWLADSIFGIKLPPQMTEEKGGSNRLHNTCPNTNPQSSSS
jgi:hypothetical protein